MWVRVRVSCRVRFSVRVSFTVRVSARVIQVAILSCNCEATQQRRLFIYTKKTQTLTTRATRADCPDEREIL